MTDATEQQTAIEELSFNQASTELEQIIRSLTSNQMELEDSLAGYERGISLLKALQQRLNEAQQRVDVLLGELEPEDDTSNDTTLS